VVDPKGKIVAQGASFLAPPARFKVPSTGTYYVVVAGDGNFVGQYAYTVGLTSP
jgi:hypothetical protein